MELLHDKAQRAFQNYVMNQHKMRQVNQNIQVSIALANNDADLILSKNIFKIFLLFFFG